MSLDFWFFSSKEKNRKESFGAKKGNLSCTLLNRTLIFVYQIRSNKVFILKIKLLLLPILLLIGINLFSQEDLQISILTCSAGQELYSAFGHTAIRVKDPSKGIDDVFNFGTFDFSQPNFYVKFTRGKLNYFLSIESFESFKRGYVYEQRAIREQVLNLTEVQKMHFVNRLMQIYNTEERFYKYDFLYNNCSTKIWELIEEVAGDGFVTEGDPLHKTFRDYIHFYLLNKPWAKLGIDISLGSPCDKVMTIEEESFLPELLEANLNESFIGDKPIVTSHEVLLDGVNFNAPATNAPFLIFTGLFLLILLLHKIRQFYLVKAIYILYGTMVFFVFMLVTLLWFWTDHDATQWNQNILWLLPVLLCLFMKKRLVKKIFHK